MRKCYILFLLLFALKSVDAQNWKPISKNEKYNYSQGELVTTIWADSIKYINTDSVFYLNRVCKKIRKVVDPIQSGVYLENQTQFLLSKIIYSAATDIFIQENDSIGFLIKPYAQLNDTWVFDSLKHDTAKVISVLAMSVFGTVDSVKIITLKTNDSIVLSKNYGILKFPDFSSIHQHFNLVGIEGRNAGTIIPMFNDIFNFKVSDVFCYLKTYEQQLSGYTIEKKIVINSKKINGDTIKYTADYKSRIRSWNKVTQSTDTSYINVGDSVLIYIDRNNTIFDGYTGMILKEGSTMGDDYYKPLKVSYYKPFDVYTKNRPYNAYRKSGPTDSIFEYSRGPYTTFHSTTYGNNLGLIVDSSYSQGDKWAFTKMEERLMGYIRDGKTTGTVFDKSIFTSVPSFKNELSFKIYPNPVQNNFTIENESNIKQGSIRVFDINGRELLQQKITSIKTELDISSLAKGVYFVKLITIDGVGARKIIKE